MTKVTLRPARNEDARGILEAHYSAVHKTAQLLEYTTHVLSTGGTMACLKMRMSLG